MDCGFTCQRDAYPNLRGQEELAEPWDEGSQTDFGGQTSVVASYSVGSQNGCNLVGDTGDVSPPLFQVGGRSMPCPSFFLFRYCVWRGFKNKSDICHVLCEELFMLKW